MCFSGLDTQRPLNGGANIRANLVAPLKADVLLAFTQLDIANSSTDCTVNPNFRDCSTAHRLLRERFVNLKPIAAIQLSSTSTTGDLVRKIEASPAWNQTYRDLSWGSCTRSGPSPHVGSDSPYHCRTLTDFGNVYLAPIIGNGAVLKEFESQSGCLSLLQRHERDSGRNYSRVVFSRLEYLWVKPHPPLSALPPEHLWTPSGETYGGVCDRHAVMRRDLAHIYFGRFDMIMDGRIRHIDSALNRTHGMSSERLLGQVLRYHNITVAKFPQVAFLQCCHGVCHTRHCYTAKMATQEPRASMFRGKYKEELMNAMINAMLLDVPGATLTDPTFNLKKRQVLLYIAMPRALATALDCNMSTDTDLRKRLPSSNARFVGPVTNDSFFQSTWDLPCPRQLLLEQLGARALSLPLVNESKAKRPPNPAPASWKNWETWMKKITSGGLSAAHPANDIDGDYEPPVTPSQ